MTGYGSTRGPDPNSIDRLPCGHDVIAVGPDRRDTVIVGGNGNDNLTGNSGNNTLDGNPGTDRCTGGAGTDVGLRCEITVGIP